MGSIGRRDLMVAGVAIALTSTLPIVPANAQPGPLLRRNIASMALDDPVLDSYRKVIAAMRSLPPSDPRNWTRQAQIHQGTAAVRCPHGNWYFLPWHRAYLVAFERICRQLSGNQNFALPYWDWTENPQLPAAFATPTYMGAPNPLYDSTRPSQTVVVPSSVAGAQIISRILSEVSFEIFGSRRPTGQNSTAQNWQIAPGDYGPLEGGPHNSTHGIVGGNMSSFMSPLDPVFWLHHCNVDRIWDQWNRLGRSNSGDSLWLKFVFANQFAVPSGSATAPYDVAVSDLLNVNALGYRYVSPLVQPELIARVRPFFPRPIDLLNLPPLASGVISSAVRVNVPLETRVSLSPVQNKIFSGIRPQIAVPESAGVRPAELPGRVVAFIRDVEPPKQGNAQVRVFVNCPYLTPETSTEDRHYAGSFSFFVDKEHHGHNGEKQTYIVDLTDTVLELRSAGIDLNETITVQLMPVPLPGASKATGENVEFRAGGIDVAII